MGLKLTVIALNRSKNHMGDRTTDKGVQAGIFKLKQESFFFPIQILLISPLRNGRRDAQITAHPKVTVYNSHRAWGTCDETSDDNINIPLHIIRTLSRS